MKLVTIAGGSVSIAATGRGNADLGGGGVGGELGGAVDAEQRGVLSGHADHVVRAAESRAVIAVRDAPGKRLRRAAGLSKPFGQL